MNYSGRNYFLVIAILFSSICMGDELDRAYDAYENEHYAKAIELFTALAEENDSEACYQLAFMYYGGDGIEKDYKKAAYWFDRSARLGHPEAQDKLGYMYLNGQGLPQNKVYAYIWYNMAAQNGIFLAENIQKKIRASMSITEKTHAELLHREFVKKYSN